MADLKETLSGIAKSVVKTSGTLVKTTKLSVSLAGEESALKAVYVEIGKKVHEIYEYGGSLGKAFDEKYLKIKALEGKINALKAQLDAARERLTCPGCGKATAQGAEFCPKCGRPFGEFIPEPLRNHEPENVNDSEAEIANGAVNVSPVRINDEPEQRRKCAGCGEKNGPREKFCLSCGRVL